MSRNFGNPGFYDASAIDDRNARPLMIAFATIVMVWMLAFGLVFVSAQTRAQSHDLGWLRAPRAYDRSIDRRPRSRRGPGQDYATSLG